MRENIINVLKNSDKALDIYELQDRLNIDTVEETKEFSEELKKLEDEVIVYHSNKDKYMMLENSHLRKGVMRANKKGFLRQQNSYVCSALSVQLLYQRLWVLPISRKEQAYSQKKTDAGGDPWWGYCFTGYGT